MRKIVTYDRLNAHVRAVADGEIQSLVIRGRPGIGKSWITRAALAGREYCLLSGRVTPIAAYKALYDKRNQPVVFDDVSATLHDQQYVDLIKGLCDTGQRMVHWLTESPLLEGRPKSFETTSPVIILLNHIPRNNPDVMAILDRCDNVEFAPTKDEVIAYMRAYFPEDGHLIDLLAMLSVIPSIRTLVKAKAWDKSRHLSLYQELLDECGVSEGINELITIMTNHPKDEWCRLYVETTGNCERTYRRDKQVAEQILSCRQTVGRDVTVPATSSENITLDDEHPDIGSSIEPSSDAA